MLTASVALAPRRCLFSVPSRSIMMLSSSACSWASRPTRASEISVLTFSTARNTPLPRKRAASPSRSSTASRVPVEAPDGTAARPMAPDSSRTSHSTVGLPRESRISRPMMSTIALMVSDPLNDVHIHDGGAGTGIAGSAILRGIVKGLRGRHAGELHDDGTPRLAALQPAGFAAAHQHLGVVGPHGQRGQPLVVFVLLRVGHRHVGNDVGFHAIPSGKLAFD